MKKFSSIVVVFILIANLYGQQIDFHQHLLNNTIRSYDFDQEDIETIRGRVNQYSKGELIWVEDSMYFYDGEDTLWSLKTRNKVLTRDVFGNVTSEIKHNYSLGSGLWTNLKLYTYSYHNKNTLDDVLEKAWDYNNETWFDTVHYFKYNENGDELIYLHKHWDMNSLELDIGFRRISSYNEYDSLHEVISISWDFNNPSWNNNQKRLYTYNVDGFLSSELIFEWESDSWKKNFLVNHDYDIFGNVSQSITEKWDEEIQDWENYRLDIYSYSINNLVEQKLAKSWNNELQDWVNYYQYFITYDENWNKTMFLSQDWNMSIADWVNAWHSLYSYDSFGNLIIKLSQNWDIGIEDWINNYQFLLTFDDEMNLIQLYEEKWDNDAGKWENKYKDDYYWSEFEVSKVNNINATQVLIFPNPTSDILQIEGLNEKFEVHVYTLNGKLILHRFIEDGEIDIANLVPGIYVLHITFEKGGLMMKKIIKD